MSRVEPIGELEFVMTRALALLAFPCSCLASSSAFAYVGPGAGISAFGALLGLLAALALVVFGFVWYPVKRLRRRLRAKAAQPDKPAQPDAGGK